MTEFLKTLKENEERIETLRWDMLFEPCAIDALDHIGPLATAHYSQALALLEQARWSLKLAGIALSELPDEPH